MTRPPACARFQQSVSLLESHPELAEVYLRGVKADHILNEVVCAGINLRGAAVTVPRHLYPLLVKRIERQQAYQLAGFLSYRADKDFAQLLLESRPDLLSRLRRFSTPISEDTDSSLLVRLHELTLLPEELRQNFYECVREAAIEEADASFLVDTDIRSVFSEDEIDSILQEVETKVLRCVPEHVDRLKDSWDKDYPPEEYFAQFKNAIRTFVKEISWRADYEDTISEASQAVQAAVEEMEADYEPPKTVRAPTSSKEISESPLTYIFRDVDE
jgi:hypothetical protein